MVAKAACFFTYYDPLAFLPGTSKLLVRASGGFQIFDLKSMREAQFLTAPTHLNGPSVAISSDGSMFAWALEQGTIEWYRFSGLVKLATLHSRQSGPIKLEFAPSGDELYSVSHFEGIKVWDRNGRLLRTFTSGDELMNIGISPDGQTLVTIPADGPVALWEAADFQHVGNLGGSGGYDTSEVAFSPDGQYLAADLAAGLYLWKILDHTEQLGAADAINSLAVAFSPDGQYLAYANGNTVVLSTPDGSRSIRTLEGHTTPVFDLVFSSDGSILVSADDVGVYVWRVSDGTLMAIGKSSCP